MTKSEVINLLKEQRDRLDLLITELEGSEIETSTSEFSAKQLSRIIADATKAEMKPLICQMTEAVRASLASSQFDDEFENLCVSETAPSGQLRGN